MSKVLRYSDLWEAFFSRAPHGVSVLHTVRDDDDRIVDFEWLSANARALKLSDLREEETVGRLFLEVQPIHRQTGLFARYVRAIESGEAIEVEQVVPARHGVREGRSWYAITAIPSGERLIVTFSSITKRKSVLLEAVKMMNHDDLTGVGNRRLLKSHFWMRRQNEEPMSLLYFDLNGFKGINDTYGHEVGDEVLRVVAQRLQKNVRPNEVVARLGGDEFAVLLDSGDPQAVALVADRLQVALNERIRLRDGTGLQLSSSVGAATFPRDGGSFEALLSAADSSMYREKRSR